MVSLKCYFLFFHFQKFPVKKALISTAGCRVSETVGFADCPFVSGIAWVLSKILAHGNSCMKN